MKKRTSLSCLFLTALFCACTLSACSQPAAGDAGSGSAASAPGGADSGQPVSASQPVPGQLFTIYAGFTGDTGNENGIYRASAPQGDNWQNLMFYDFKALEERCLCQEAGCAHDKPGCTSYVADGGGLNPFTDGKYLYVNYAMYDRSGIENPDARPSVIEKRSLDGSGGEVMIDYPSCELQVDQVFSDGEALYFNAPDGFVRLDIETYEKTIVKDIGTNIISMDTGPDEVPESTVILPQPYRGRLLYKVTEKSGVVHLTAMDVASGEEEVLASWERFESHPWRFSAAGVGYYVDAPTGEVRRYDIASGEDTLVTDFFCQFNLKREQSAEDDALFGEYWAASAWDVSAHGDWLLVNRWHNFDENGDFEPPLTTTTAYHLETGEMKEVSFHNYFNGYNHPVNIWGETPYGLLVTEEVRTRMIYSTGTDGAPYNFESAYDIFAIITLEDFIDSNPNFQTLQPVEYSGT